MTTDPHAWLEDVDGPEAMSWVRDRSAKAEADLRAEPGFEDLRRTLQDVLEARDRIPLVTQVGAHLYNFWTDADHPRGVWRRTGWASYRTASPDWEVLLDLDALGEAEGETWVWHGARILRPDHDRALVALSRGGSDADVTRELDLTTREFVTRAFDESGGFVRAESKGSLAWVDRDTVFAMTDVGDGSMTRSGYPRTVRRWTRAPPWPTHRRCMPGMRTICWCPPPTTRPRASSVTSCSRRSRSTAAAPCCCAPTGLPPRSRCLSPPRSTCTANG